MSSARLLLLALSLSPDISSAASPPPIRVQLEVRSALDCASRANLVERVRGRSPKIQFVDSAGEVVIGVTFSRHAEVYAGELAWLEADKPTRVRRFDAASCEQAVDAVALILAITLDPDASAEVAEAGGNTSEVVERPAGASNDSGAATVSELESRVEPTASEPNGANVNPQNPGPVQPMTPSSEVHDGSRWVFTGGVGAELGIGAAPSVMPGAAAFVALSATSSSPLALEFVLGGAWSWSPTSKQAEGNADFELGVLLLDVCAANFTWANVRLSTCAAASMGRLEATGYDAVNAAGTVARPFYGAGVSSIVNVALDDHVAVLARLSPQLNLVRDEFEFGERVFHRVPPLSFYVTVGIAARGFVD